MRGLSLASGEGLCNAQEHFGSARRRFPGLCASAKRQKCMQEPESGDQGTSKPAGKIVKIDQILLQGSFPAVFPHHWKTRFRLIQAKQRGHETIIRIEI